jgi:predicted phosphodiesterase
MLIYFFGDIHGNEYALDACLQHMDKIVPDKVYCLGDIVGWLPFGDKTLLRMKSLGFDTVAGNHDLMVGGLFTDNPEQTDRMQASAYNAALLSTIPGSIDYLLNLPLSFENENYVVVHHSPFSLPSPKEQITISNFNYLDQQALAGFLKDWASYSKHLIFSGHDHDPMVYELCCNSDSMLDSVSMADIKIHKPADEKQFTVSLNSNSKYWIKAGSVGGPYRDKVFAANSVLYDTDKEEITLFRIFYPKEKLLSDLSLNNYCKNIETLKRSYLAFR